MKTVERVVGQGVPFDRVRRITGYLVGTLERFNNAKRSEVRDRVRHAGPERGAQLRGARPWPWPLINS